jgi:uncharacterized protein with beta-barrel porin domain
VLKRTALRTTLLTTSSVLALVVALDRPASAASCTVVSNPSLPYIQSGNTCVNFTASPVTSGNVTSTGTVSATGPTFAQSRTGITVYIGVSLNGGITNQGTINANGGGIFMDQSTVTGSVVNATGAAITAANGINLGGAGGGGRNASVGGSVINNGSIDTLGSGGIGVGNIVVTGSVINGSTGTITGSGAGMFISNASVGGSISNGGTISVGHAFTALAVVNGGTVAGNVINTGSITNANASTNIGIWLEGQTVGGSLSNGGTITAGFGMYVSNSPNNGGGTVAGNVVNSKTIVAQSASGIVVAGATVQGMVSNSGTITAHQVGIAVTTGYHSVPGTVVGGIVNTGSISGVTGIAVTKGSVIPGGITTSGTINGSTAAINLSGEGAPTTITVLGGAITGNVIGGSDTMNFTLGSGSFSYSNTISGMTAVNVNSGTLFDGGSISAGSVHINGGGVLAPGLPHTVGTLSITGSLAFASAAVYLDTISGANAGKTVVSGTATLSGASVQVASGSTIQFNTRYTILTANSGVTGTFNPAITYNGDTGTLSYDADDVYLTFGEPSLLALLPPGAPRNVVDVANAIDNFFSSGGALPPQFSSLFNLSGAQLQNALTQLDGEDSTGAEGGAFHLMNGFLELMLDPYVYGRGDSGSGGQPLGFAPDQADSLPPDIALAYASLLKAPPKQSFQQRWTAWGSGFGGSATANGNPGTGSNNVTTGTFGYAAGLDYHYSPDTVVGFALSGGGTNWNLAQGLGTGRSDAFLAGIYGVTHQGPAYAAGSLAFANNWFTTNRVALGDQLTASFQGQSYAARLEGGYRFAMPTAHNVVGVTPYAAIQAQNFRTPSYSETDLTSGGFGLTYAAMNGTDTRSELGARFDDLTALGYLPLMLRARVAWAHDWLTNPALDASFESLPGSSFTVFGAPTPHDSALTSAGAELFFTPNWSLLAKFDGEFASGSQLYAGSGTLRYTW